MSDSSRILSSTAKRAYWLGRYLERADSTARLVMVNSRLLYDLPKRLPLGWQGLVGISGASELFVELFGRLTAKFLRLHHITCRVTKDVANGIFAAARRNASRATSSDTPSIS